ncbi:hypothetical protein GOARA_040_00040 [Gordonia araii NBRC 100433]|uniref:DUF1761 domain-containing protein n=1 Tax=Gordonia araii NBRC 100433 TaxID=1073574 RepID=G7H0V4_9ACTN|nr:DUF1761 domain-containing protein [Gordonia araii]NNG97702.1 DUF1761 domain-containing protein [Gordonia araii NBRC 100433]GAB09479.1 hypothetical protein GOARA_040_00040 [Gordonia araii NBRC 100433]
MVPEINYWAVLLATLSSMVIGSIWYTPKVFGNRWMELAKVSEPDSTASAVRPILVSILMAFVTAWVLAGAATIAWDYQKGSFFWTALLTAAVLWAGFTAARVITHDSFEGRPLGLTTLTLAYEATAIAAMAVIIGVWPPAGIG